MFSDGTSGDDEFRGIVRYDHSNNSLQLWSNSAERLRIDSSGRVGIGTTSPSAQIEIEGNVSSTTQFSGFQGLRVQNANGAAFGVTADINFVAGTGSGNRGAAIGVEYMSGSKNDLYFATSGGSVTSTDTLTERMRIDSSGNVGIGTIPSSLNATNGYALRLNGGSQTFIAFNNSTHTTQTAGGFVIGNDSVNAYIVQRENQGIVFSTNNTERMRIDADGMMRIRGTATSGALNVFTGQSAASNINLILGQHSSSGVTNGTLSFLVLSNGNVQNTNNSYGAISDSKLKENIVDAGSQWDDFKAVRFRKYNFKEETGHETFTQLGVIAQELELVSPGLVTETPDLDEEGNDLGTTTKGVKYSILTKKALVALQEAMDRIETLETKVASLEASS